MTKPSTIRYIRNEKQVWTFLWRLMPKAVRALRNSKEYKESMSGNEQYNRIRYNDGVNY